MNSNGRAPGLDGLRGLAAAAVVLLHVWMFSGAHQPWQPERLDAIVGSLGLAVMLFFVLSGALLAAPWIRASTPGSPAPSVGRYALRRTARIVPGYVACVLLGYVLMRAIDHPLAISASELPAFLLFAQNQFDATAGQLNPPLWSLGIEAAFYVAIPLIGLALIQALRRSGTTGAIVVCAVLVAAGLAWNAMVVGRGEPVTLLTSLPTFLPIFACGIAAAVALQHHQTTRLSRVALITLGSALVVADGWWHLDGTGWLGHVARDLPAGVGFAMILVAVAQGRAHLLGAAPMRRLGDYSFGIYLWHMPVIYVLRHQEHWPESPWAAYARVLAIATVLGAASWHLLERPAITWAAARTRRANAAPAPVSATTGAGHHADLAAASR